MPWVFGLSTKHVPSAIVQGSALTMQRGEPGESPAGAKGSEAVWGCALGGTGGAYFKKVWFTLASEGVKQKVWLRLASDLTLRLSEEGLPTVATPMFSQGQSQTEITGGSSLHPLWHPRRLK